MDWKRKLGHICAPSILATIFVILPLLLGCERTFKNPPLRVFPDMDEQQKVKPQTESSLFEYGQSIQTPVPETIARGELEVSSPNQPEWDLKRGKYMFESYCSPCHNKDGEGFGPVVQKGFIPPPSLITGRAKDWSQEAIHKVIQEGQGVMPSYAHLIDHADRMRIVMYLKKLQGETKK